MLSKTIILKNIQHSKYSYTQDSFNWMGNLEYFQQQLDKSIHSFMLLTVIKYYIKVRIYLHSTKNLLLLHAL